MITRLLALQKPRPAPGSGSWGFDRPGVWVDLGIALLVGVIWLAALIVLMKVFQNNRR